MVDSALALWEERERERLELLEMLVEGDRSIHAGENIEIPSEEDIDAFFEGIKREGRARFAQK